MVVKELTSPSEFKDALANSPSKIVVVDFYATWCGPCKIVGPVVEKFSADDEFADKADFYKIDVDQLQSVAAEQGVSAMPTFLLFKDGEKIATVLGANPKRLREEIVAAVAKL